MRKYNDNQIDAVLKLLDGIEVKGIDNCKRITMISSILMNGDDHDNSKEQNASDTT